MPLMQGSWINRKPSPSERNPSAEETCLLTVSNVSKHFGATNALRGVSVDFHSAEVHCLLGENGAGKSTLGKIIGGLYASDGGDIKMRGESVFFSSPGEARSAGIAIVYQELSLLGDLSVRANFWLGGEDRRRPWNLLKRDVERARMAEIIEALGLADIDVERPAKSLPVTTQQLLEIGKALLLRPALIVFDEPTAMLGASEKERLFNIMRRLKAEGIASIFITHHIEDVLAVGDRVTILRNGAVKDSFEVFKDTDEEDVLERLTGRRNIDRPERSSSENQNIAMTVEFNSLPATTRAVTVPVGSIVGLYGVVGCGAQEVAELIVGLRQHGGESICVKCNGNKIMLKGPHQALSYGIAYLPAGRVANVIFPGLSIKDNLMITQLQENSKLGFVIPSNQHGRALAQLTEARVKYESMDQGIESLSGGNQQKIMLVRAIASARHILVIEEPTAGIDIGAKAQIHYELRRAAKGGLSIIVVSSDLQETVSLCDRVYTFYKGLPVHQYDTPGEGEAQAIIADILGQALG